jgi:hypothetical protein
MYLNKRQKDQLDALSSMVASARHAFKTQALIIAGGAPRDVLSKTRVKDIDLFIDLETLWPEGGVSTSVASELFMNRCAVFMANLGYPEAKLEFNEPGEYGVDVCDIKYGTGAPIQIVGLHDVNPVEDVHNYDFGLSQVFVSEGGLFMTPAAQLDRMNMTITYMDNAPDTAAFERSVRRYHRLKEKYWGAWKFVNCEKLESYQNENDL